MTAFRIEIPGINLVAYSTEEVEQAGHLIKHLSGKVCKSYAPNHDILIYTGVEKHPLAVTLLAAMAQGHTLGPIINHILEEQLKGTL